MREERLPRLAIRLCGQLAHINGNLQGLPLPLGPVAFLLQPLHFHFLSFIAILWLLPTLHVNDPAQLTCPAMRLIYSSTFLSL